MGERGGKGKGNECSVLVFSLFSPPFFLFPTFDDIASRLLWQFPWGSQNMACSIVPSSSPLTVFFSVLLASVGRLTRLLAQYLIARCSPVPTGRANQNLRNSYRISLRCLAIVNPSARKKGFRIIFWDSAVR